MIDVNNVIRKVVLKKNNNKVTHTEGGKVNMINCHNCGASIDVMKDKCDFCDTPNNYNQEWYLDKIK